ncbi:dynactin subunit 1-like isoform X2 [Notothenia coriiceps]|uniref:Dynactin subunit 1 n=1 Tax=Notothenia coriiceps TaxID=8208 RepID=A0A6I9P2G1_9TELE|nr:PREDICTED: dynactin subunit 1-like isoform X2 [Notothenia coriiceps]
MALNRRHSYTPRLTSALISKMSSTGTVESSRPPKIGSTVEVTGKGQRGTVAYIGATLFASGKWVGVILDEAKGKNDGTVQGKRYFTCEENHGIFVRQSQLQVVDDGSGATSPETPESGIARTLRQKDTPETPRSKQTPVNIKKSSTRRSAKWSTPGRLTPATSLPSLLIRPSIRSNLPLRVRPVISGRLVRACPPLCLEMSVKRPTPPIRPPWGLLSCLNPAGQLQHQQLRVQLLQARRRNQCVLRSRTWRRS